MHYYRHLIGIFGGILVVIFATSNILVIGSLSSPEVENQEPEQISAQITQAREDIENELKKQGEILTEAIKQQFGFENVTIKSEPGIPSFIYWRIRVRKESSSIC